MAAHSLHRASLAWTSLTHFVMFSSMASLVPSTGQAMYAGANCALSRLGDLRAAQGLPSQVVDFGPWKDTGMMRGVRWHDNAASSVFQQLRPDMNLNALDAILGAGTGRFAVFARAAGSAVTPGRLDSVKTAPAGNNTWDTIGLGKVASLTVIRDNLLRLIAEETGADPSSISGNNDLEGLGMESIAIMRLKTEMRRNGVYVVGSTMTGLNRRPQSINSATKSPPKQKTTASRWRWHRHLCPMLLWRLKTRLPQP